MHRLLLTVIFFCSMSLVTYGQTPTTTAVPFLQIAPDARSAGMGDMGLATGGDVYSGMHNTAATSFAPASGGVGVSYTPWLRNIVQGMYLLSGAGYRQLDANSAVSAGVRYFSLGNVGVSNYDGTPLTTAHPREYSLEAGYSRKLSTVLGIGLTGRYVRSDLGSGSVGGTMYKAANAVAVDVSAYYDSRGADSNAAGLVVGLVGANLGSKLSYSNDAKSKEDLPSTLGLGVAYHGVVDEDNRWMAGVEGKKLVVPSFGESAYTFSGGVEYAYKGQLFLRAGYLAETAAAGDLKYATAGVGLKYSTMGIDLSYLAPSGNGAARSAVSNTFRLGLAVLFH